MYDRIIVPIDEGDSMDAVAAARPLARMLGCALTLLHVHHPQEAPAELEGLPQFRYQGVVETWDDRDREAEEHEVEWLNRLAESVVAAESTLTVTSRVVHAPLSRRLHDEGERVLVVAAAREAHLDGLPIAVRELLAAGGVPVLLVRAGQTLLPLGRVLITLDGSPFSCEVIKPALDLARATSARVSLLEVVTRHNGLVRLLRPGERSAESAERFLRRVRAEIGEELGTVDVRVAEKGNAAAGIVEEARRGDVDVVAMATHGRGGLRRLILGSVAESVLRGSALPMLLYRPIAVDAGEPAWGSVKAAPVSKGHLDTATA
jgi:nucleotide-binding universal stress UspA family protein